MNALERLLLEAIPQRPAPEPARSPWTAEQQDQHWSDLCHTVGTPNARRPERPHLRLVTDAAA